MLPTQEEIPYQMILPTECIVGPAEYIPLVIKHFPGVIGGDGEILIPVLWERYKERYLLQALELERNEKREEDLSSLLKGKNVVIRLIAEIALWRAVGYLF